MQCGERVDAAVERFVSFTGGLKPIPHGVAAHEARADLLAGELVEKFLLIGDREIVVARPGRGIFKFGSAKRRTESSENSVQFNGADELKQRVDRRYDVR